MSVIIPVYGTEDYLEDCLISVVQQTYANLEILLIDDGSPDRCPAICDAFAARDSRITVIHKHNEGQGPARNTGLEACHGDWVMFVDSDDTVRPNMVAHMLEAALANECDLALSGYAVSDPLRTREYLYFDAPMVFSAEALMREYLTGDAIGRGPWAKLFSRSFFASVRFPALKAREDVYVMHELIGASRRSIFVPEALYIWRTRPHSIEHSGFSSDWLASMEAADRLVGYVDSNYASMSIHAVYRRAETAAGLMRGIRQHFAYMRNRQVYEVLLGRLRQDLDSVLHRDGAYPCATALTVAADDSSAFWWNCIQVGVKRSVYFRVSHLLSTIDALKMKWRG